MEKTIAVIGIGALVMIVLVNAIAESAAYLTDMIGEILIICGMPIVLAAIGYVIYRIFIDAQVGRINALERNLHLERLAIENEGMRRDLLVMRPIDNVFPVARHLIESGEVVNQSFQLLSENIDSRRTYPNMPNSISYTNKNDNHVSDAVSAEPVNALGVGDLSSANRSNEIMLGNTVDGPLWAEPQKVKSIVCGGMSGSGKSNTTRFLLMQYAKLGYKLAIFDPHGNSEEGILPSLMPLSSSFFMEPATEIDEGMEMLRCIIAEGERRSRVPNSKRADFEPLLFVIDEVAQIASFTSPEDLAYAKQNLPIILNSYRKFNIYAMCISQFWSKPYMGDLGFLLRQSAQTSIIHRMDPDSAQIIEKFADLREINDLTTGVCLFNNTDIKAAKLTIPLCEPSDIMGVAHSVDDSEKHSVNPSAQFQIEQQETHEMTLPQNENELASALGMTLDEQSLVYVDAASELTPSQRMRIEDALAAGDGNGKIIIDVFDHLGKTKDHKGRKYARMINGVRIEMGMELPYSPARKNKQSKD